MKLCTFEVRTALGRSRRLGAYTPAGVTDLNSGYSALLHDRGLRRTQVQADALVPPDMLLFLQMEEQGMDLARQVEAFVEPGMQGPGGETLLFAPGDLRLRAPLPNPASVRDFFAFEQHVKMGFEKRGEPMPREWYEMPVYYKSGHHNILGPDDDAPWPRFTEKFDYELELAAIVGRRASNVRGGAARACLAGFTVMNDFSARDIQRREMKVRLGPSKGKDWATALGPYLVTPDEIPDAYRLEMMARVNGEEWSRGNSSSMHWKFEQMIEFLTEDDTVHPGDVIGSGTVGTGCGLELNRWVQPGDVIELEIERIGALRNRVVRAAV